MRRRGSSTRTTTTATMTATTAAVPPTLPRCYRCSTNPMATTTRAPRGGLVSSKRFYIHRRIVDDTYGTLLLKSRKHHLCKTHSQVGRNTTSDSTHIIISSLKRARHNLDGWYGVLASCSARTITATDDRSTRRLRNLELVITGSTESCVVHMTISWAVASHAILATLLIARAGAFSSPFIPRNTPTTHQTNLFGIKGFRSWFESGIARRSLAVPSRH